jgi:perosamine synthetase
LYFQVKKFEKGSEIIFSAVNIPDMVRIVKEHGLIPVPFDVDPRTMEPVDPEALRKLITPKTKAFLGAYVYGIRYDPTPFIKICKESNVDYIEDVAQTYQGTSKWTGHPEAVMTMFSFGLIKVQATYNGAISVVRDKKLYEQMKQL